MFYDAWLPSRKRPSLLKGATAGLVGGAVATWVMTQFQNAVPPETFAQLLGESSGDDTSGESGEPSTVKAAEAISEGVFGHELTKAEKKQAGPAVHYATGLSAGAAYGALAEVWGDADDGFGLPFGTFFWLAADEVAVPALGLSDPPTEQPPSVHLYGLAAHLVYGLTTDIVRRLVRKALG